MAPRSLFMPIFSRPRFSSFPVTPTAEITRSTVSVAVPPLPGSLFLSSLVTLAPVSDIDSLLLEALAREGGRSTSTTVTSAPSVR